MTADNQSLPPLPLFLRKLGIKACAEVMDYGDDRAAHARRVALEEAARMFEGGRWQMTGVAKEIRSLK